MRHYVLGIGYRADEQEAVQAEWMKYGLIFDFADDFPCAIQRFTNREYVCVTICSDILYPGSIELLRSIKPIPIVVLSNQCSVGQRAQYMQYGAAQYIFKPNIPGPARPDKSDSVQHYLEFYQEQKPPLTIITTKDLYYCKEYRTIEIKGRTVNLTAKEFDILTLLIKNPQRVFTFEMIMDLVWGEEYTYYARKTINNHMGNLRRKLKIDETVPDYIISVHSVGYKLCLKIRTELPPILFSCRDKKVTFL